MDRDARTRRAPQVCEQEDLGVNPIQADGTGSRPCTCAGSVEELEELGRGQARPSQDRRQRAALHDAVLRDDGHAPLPVPVHSMTALGPHMGEAD